MNEGQLVGLVSLVGSLILGVTALRAHRLQSGRMIVFMLVWGAIFAAVAAVFSAVS